MMPPSQYCLSVLGVYLIGWVGITCPCQPITVASEWTTACSHPTPWSRRWKLHCPNQVDENQWGCGFAQRGMGWQCQKKEQQMLKGKNNITTTENTYYASCWGCADEQEDLVPPLKGLTSLWERPKKASKQMFLNLQITVNSVKATDNGLRWKRLWLGWSERKWHLNQEGGLGRNNEMVIGDKKKKKNCRWIPTSHLNQDKLPADQRLEHIKWNHKCSKIKLV